MLHAQGSFRQDRKQAIFNSLCSVNKNIPVRAQFLSLKIHKAGEMSVYLTFSLSLWEMKPM